MKEAEAKLLMGSGVIDRAVLYREWTQTGPDTGSPGLWEVHLYGDDLPPHIKNPVELARGGRRTWSSLDTAYSWITTGFGPRVAVEIDDAFVREMGA